MFFNLLCYYNNNNNKLLLTIKQELFMSTSQHNLATILFNADQEIDNGEVSSAREALKSLTKINVSDAFDPLVVGSTESNQHLFLAGLVSGIELPLSVELLPSELFSTGVVDIDFLVKNREIAPEITALINGFLQGLVRKVEEASVEFTEKTELAA